MTSRDAFPHIGTPPSHDVRWQFTAYKVKRFTREHAPAAMERYICVVTARTYYAARVLAYREFARQGLYEPEQVTAFMLRDARPIAENADTRRDKVKGKSRASSVPADFSSLHDDVSVHATAPNGSLSNERAAHARSGGLL